MPRLLLVIENDLCVEHDLLLPREHAGEQLHGVLEPIALQPPNVLLLRARKSKFCVYSPFDGLADFSDLEILGRETYLLGLLLHFD